MKKQQNKNGRPKKQFHIYTQVVDNEKEVLVSLKKLDEELEENKEKQLKFICNCNFHPIALNDVLKNHNIGFGERFYWVYKYFKFSIED